MKVAGIVAEYNPFHNGHKYQIDYCKKELGADYVVVVMSGDYVQRGEPAVFPKEVRAKTALLGGADLVLMLPAASSLSSAEGFAFDSVRILHALGCVDLLVFGCESEDTNLCRALASYLVEEPADYQTVLKEGLKEGMSFPLARSRALQQCFPLSLDGLLDQPNFILGVEYCKALLRLNSPIQPKAIRRVGSNYHDSSLSGSFSSAAAIRQAIFSASDYLTNIPPDLPPLYQNCPALQSNDFSLLLHAQLLRETKEGLCLYEDLSPFLANRICHLRQEFRDFDSFAALLKTRDLTLSRVKRLLMKITLGMTREMEPPAGIRMLGFRRESAALFGRIREKAELPLLSRSADLGRASSWKMDLYASGVYRAAVLNKSGVLLENELKQKMIIV